MPDGNNSFNNKVTLSDVASLAHVSEATVSRVLNNNPSVSSHNREAVLAAAEQLGYIPRKKANNGSIQSVALCLSTRPDGDDPLAGDYFAPIVVSVEAECRRQGINLTLVTLRTGQENVQEIQRVMRQGNVDSLLIMHLLDPEIVESLLELDIPCVVLGAYFPWLPIDSVNSEAFTGVLTAVQHFIDNGHREIAYIDGPNPPWNDYWVNMRRVAYQYALARAGIDYDPELIVYGDLSRKGGEQAMQKLLDSGRTFSAILCCNDQSAFGAVHVLQNAGLKIPDDVSMIGHDDVQAATLITPALTTIHVQREAMSRMAVRLLIERAHDPGRPVRHVLTAERLITRDSVRNLNGETIQPANVKIMP